MKSVRCAIYTRKSSDEGLEQSFNSLDAQREACAAYILSQASEGWTEVAGHYDDGGLSGGTLERPALQRLLADVAAGTIDIIVVYKVDRLTRSLLDFSRLVEAFDAAGTSFVSVTQSFNTTTSMGRLTLNMLLSFAQFEREVTAERIRDKIAASKAKGMWMGGTPPLGYRPDGRSLAVVEDEAAIVRHVFARYLALGNVRRLEVELKAEGIIAPRRVSNAGKVIGDVPFSRGTLYLMLRRVTYTGRIPHGDKIYPGNHPAIIDVETFNRVAALLAAHRQGDGERTRVSRPSLLAGRIVDAEGAPLIATHATKPGATSAATTRYRYYVSRALHHKESDRGMRLPAREIETLVTNRVAALFDDPIALVGTAWLDVPFERYADLHHRCAELAAKLRERDPSAMAMVEKVQVHSARVDVVCRTAEIVAALDVTLHADAPATLTLTDAVRLTRSGRAMRLVHDGSHATPAATDAALIRLIVQARRWWSELKQGEIDIAALAAREGKTSSYVTRVVRLAFLAPIVLEAILDGRQRVGVDARRLTLDGPLPARWVAQEQELLPA